MCPFNDCQLPVALPHLGPSIAVPNCLLPHCLVSTGFTASKPSDITSFIFSPFVFLLAEHKWKRLCGQSHSGDLFIVFAVASPVFRTALMEFMLRNIY